MPDSSIDIVSPMAATDQPRQLTVNVEYDNQSGGNVWVRVECSFNSGGGSHFVTSSSTVGPGAGSFDANFPHSSDQSGVSVSARLTEFSSGLGTLYAAAVVGDVTITNGQAIAIDRGMGFGMGYLVITEAKGAGSKSTLRLNALAASKLELSGSYDKTKGSDVTVMLVGGKKKRPHVIYETRAGEVMVDAKNQTWTATIPAKVIDGQRPRGAMAILLNDDGVYVAADSVGLKD